ANHDGLIAGDDDDDRLGVATESWTETDPLNPDTDGDSINDGLEDTDENGAIAGDDNDNRVIDNGETWAETNPLSSDSDGDGIPDSSEDRDQSGTIDGDDDSDRLGFPGEAWTETDPANPDTDGDGIVDGLEDRAPFGVIAGDTNNDRAGVAVETWLESDPLNPDSDGDLILDGQEGRPLPGGGFDWGEDIDADNKLNPVDLDSDGDGIDDADELADVSAVDNVVVNLKWDDGETWPDTYAYQSDSDGDGMPDGWEILYGLKPLDPRDADEDLDGGNLSNLSEYEKKRDPTNIADDNTPDPEANAAAYAVELAQGDVQVNNLIAAGDSTSLFAGNFSGTATFDGFTLLGSPERPKNAFVGLRTHETDWVWLGQLSSSERVTVNALAHHIDFVYVAGSFSGRLLYGVPGEVGTQLASATESTGFILKLSRADGGIEGSMFTSDLDLPRNSINGIAVNDDGIAFCGRVWPQPTAQFGLILVAKTTLQFNLQWWNAGGHPELDNDANAVAIEDGGDVYVTGKISGIYDHYMTSDWEGVPSNSCKVINYSDSGGSFLFEADPKTKFYSNSLPYNYSYDYCGDGNTDATGTDYKGTAASLFLGKFAASNGWLIASAESGHADNLVRPEGEGLSILLAQGEVVVGGRYDGNGFVRVYDTSLVQKAELLIENASVDAGNAVSRLGLAADGFLMAGKFNLPTAEFSDTLELNTVKRPNIFLGKARYETGAISVEWVRSTSEYKLLPPETVEIAGVSHEAANNGRATYAGYFTGTTDKTLHFGSAVNPAQLVHPGTDSTYTSFLSQYSEELGDYVDVLLLEIVSAYGDGVVRPGVGSFPYLSGQRVVVEFPRRIYKNPSLPDLIIWDSEDDEPNTQLYNERYTTTGYRLGDAQSYESGNRYEFVITQKTRIQIDWRTDFKLTVASQVTVPDDDPIQDETRATLGSPDPATGVHWIPKAEEVAPKVMGVAPLANINAIGTRYALAAYTGTGSAPSSSGNFTMQEGELQIGNTGDGTYFIMTQPSTLTYSWEKQYQIETRVSRVDAESHPIVHLPNDSTLDKKGAGSFWYTHGSRVQLGTKVGDRQLSAVGWLIASGHVSPVRLPNENHGSLRELVESGADGWKQVTIDATPYYVLDIATLTQATKVFWDYGETIVYTNRALGDHLQHYFRRGSRTDAVTLEPTVKVLQSPAGSGPDDMQIWDQVQSRLHPLRPGAILISWERADQSQTVLEWLQVGFPGASIVDYSGNPDPGESFWIRDTSGQPTRIARHFQHILGSAPVLLDPSAEDRVALIADRFFFQGASDDSLIGNQNVDTNVIPDTVPLAAATDARIDSEAATFTSDAEGKSVLLFSRSSASSAAQGDVTREALFVRIVETRDWDASDWSIAADLKTQNAEAPGINVVLELNSSAGLEPGDRVCIIDGVNDEFDVEVNAVRTGATKVTGITLDLNRSYSLPARLVTDLTVTRALTTTTSAAVAAGADVVVPVAAAVGFRTGDVVDIDKGGANQELAVGVLGVDTIHKTITLNLATDKGAGVEIERADAPAGSAVVVPVASVSELRVGDYVDVLGTNQEFGRKILGIDAFRDTITLDLLSSKARGVKVVRTVGNLLYAETGNPDVLVEVRNGGGITVGDTVGLVEQAAPGNTQFGMTVKTVSTIRAIDVDLATAKTAQAQVLPLLAEISAAALDAATATVTVTVDDSAVFSTGSRLRFIIDDASLTSAWFPVYSIDSAADTVTVGVIDADVPTATATLYPEAAVPITVATNVFPANLVGARIYPVVDDELYRTAPASAEVGVKITNSRFDTAGIESGYLRYGSQRGNYNASIYGDAAAWSATSPTPIIPVNRVYLSDVSVAATPLTDLEKGLLVLWYESKTEEDVSLLWPYRPELYREFHWPSTAPDPGAPTTDRRIVIASRLGSEGMDSAGNEQFSFDPGLYQDVLLYNQPETTLPGYNPNEEHALIAPSFLYLNEPVQPACAYALRNDLNQTTWGTDYTSAPYVLVQYTDVQDEEAKMAVYKVELTAPNIDDARVAQLLAPDVVPAASAKTFKERSHAYDFAYWTKAGEPLFAPYPLNLVIGASSHNNSANGTWSSPDGTIYKDKGSSRTWWVDHRGQGWIASGNEPANFANASFVNAVQAKFWYPLRSDFWHADRPVLGTPIPWMNAGIIVEYPSVWPNDVPVLKAGETLTYAGGEFRADNP
ncbi:MAG: hypothetical protein ACI84D_003274, partial [Thalassolituus oleivorans]